MAVKSSKKSDKKEQKAKERLQYSDKGGAWDTGGSTRVKEEDVLLEIREHPFLERWYVSVLAVALITASSVISYFILRHPLTPVFIFAFFIISNTSFFMPSRYVFTKEKFVIDRIIYRKSYPWKRFRGYDFDRNGIYLSPTADPDRFDCFRGVFLVMGSENRQSLKPILEEKIG